MKPLTLCKCLTCVHLQWQVRVQKALNLFVSVHLPNSNVSSFVWRDLRTSHIAIKNLHSLQTCSRKQTTNVIKAYLQVVLRPSSYLDTLLGRKNCFPKQSTKTVCFALFFEQLSLVEIVHWCSGVIKNKALYLLFLSWCREILSCQKGNTLINIIKKSKSWTLFIMEILGSRVESFQIRYKACFTNWEHRSQFRLLIPSYLLGWYQRPHSLGRGSTAIRLLGLWVRIPPEGWMFVCCDYCVLPGRGLCVRLITWAEESYRVWCVWTWSWIPDNGRPWSEDGLQLHRNKKS